MALQFEWDSKKAKLNLVKHGVSFKEALTVFADPLAKIFDDEEHSAGERREILIGHSGKKPSSSCLFPGSQDEGSADQRSKGNAFGAKRL